MIHGTTRWFRTGPKIEKPRITREFSVISHFWGTDFHHYAVVIGNLTINCGNSFSKTCATARREYMRQFGL